MLSIGLNVVKTAISRITTFFTRDLQASGQGSTDYLAGSDQTGSDHLIVIEEV